MHMHMHDVTTARRSSDNMDCENVLIVDSYSLYANHDTYYFRSELRGMGKIKVHVHYEAWTTSIELTVWYPKLPITVWISDPVLNAVKGYFCRYSAK